GLCQRAAAKSRLYAGWRRGAGSGDRRMRDALLGQHLLQFAGLEHLTNDVTAAHELTLNVELRDRRPFAERLDSLADAHVLEHINVLILDTEVLKDLCDLP